MNDVPAEIRHDPKPGFADLDFTRHCAQTAPPSLEELVGRARELRPMLRGRQAETEALSQPPLDVWQMLLDAGFFKIITPRRYGGWEMGVWPFVKITLEIARGCMSTAWCYSLGYGHAYTGAAYFPQEAQDEMFGETGYLCAASFAYPCGKARRVEGGYVVTGDFPYGSGSPYSNYYMGEFQAPAGSPHGPEGSLLFFSAPRDQYELLDDWHGIMGLRGSGSQTVRLNESFIPDRLMVATCFSNLRAIDGTTLGHELHGNPFYRLPQLGFAACYANAVVIGGSLAACDEFEHVARTKPPRVPGALNVQKFKYQAQVQDVQRNFALGLADVEASEGILRATSEDLAALGEREYDMTDCLSVVLRLSAAGKFAWKAVEDRLWRTIGSSQAREGKRMERYWRDLSTYWNSPNNGYRELFAVGYAQGRWADLLAEVDDGPKSA